MYNTLFIIIIFLELQNQYIRMISDGFCDTEDWSNDAENSAVHHSNKLHLKTVILNCNNIL